MQDPYWFDRIERSLGELDALEERIDAFRKGARVGSRAAGDAAIPNGSLAWSQGLAALQVAMDHLRAWRHLHSKMQPPFAHWTLLRSAVEACATTRWVLEPGADNAARGVAAEIDDLSQRQGFEARMRDRMSWAPAPKVSAPKRLRPLKARKVRAMPGSMSRTGTHLPAAVISDRNFDGEVLYRLLSAIAHAKMWAMPILGHTDRGEAVPGAPELAITSLTAPGDIVWLLTGWSVDCLRSAIEDAETYAGW